MTEQPMEIVTVRVEQKPAGLFLSSDQVPGLFLWGKDPEAVFADLVPAIRALYLHNRAMRVDVRPLSWPQRDDSGAIVPSRFGIFPERRRAKSA